MSAHGTQGKEQTAGAAAAAANRASLPLAATVRQDLRQEPYEVIRHVRICAGGAGQPAFLPR